MTRENTALRMTVLRVLVDELGKVRTVENDTVKETWTVGDRLAGKLPSGDVIGFVTVKKGSVSPAVTDREKFAAWVAEAHPEEIETVVPDPITRVRPAYEKRLLDAAKKAGVPVDTSTGEEIPGVTVRQGDPIPAVTLADDAVELVAKAWRSGQLAELVGSLLAIEGGES